MSIGLFLLYLIIACLIIYYLRAPQQLPWWIKVTTQKPDCIYYFGPFTSQQEAELEQAGYLEDLEQEGAEKIEIVIEQGQPKSLTIFEDEYELNGHKSLNLEKYSTELEANWSLKNTQFSVLPKPKS